jgi:hypothetical protein
MKKIHSFTAKIEVPEFAQYDILEFEVFRTENNYILVPVYKANQKEIDSLANQISFDSNWKAEVEKYQNVITWVKEVFEKKQWELY